jgi:hypothetical protein
MIGSVSETIIFKEDCDFMVLFLEYLISSGRRLSYKEVVDQAKEDFGM